MQTNPTVTAAEIARLAGVGRAAVSNWRKRHADFPAQVGGTAASPEFDLAQVKHWLRDQGKLSDLSTEDMLWWHLAAAGDNQVVTLGAVGAFLLNRRRGEPTDAMTGDPRLAELCQEVAALADERGVLETFDDLLRQFAQSPSARVRPTPDDLSELMAGLADVTGGSVLDPACGTGSLLRFSVRAGCTSAYGQDTDEPTAQLARLWLALHDVPGDVQVGDSLRADAFVGRAVDAIVCSPPFGISNWGQEELGYDPRWEYGTPPRTEPELAWVQHALAHLRPDGRAVLLMPPAAAGRRAGRRIRAELLRRGALRAVIALPARVAAPHGVPLHLWVLRRPVPDASPPVQVLLVDASGASDAEVRNTYSRILAVFRAFTDEPDAPTREPGFARTVSVIELLDDEVDLNPVRRPAVISAKDSGERLTTTRKQLAALVADLPGLIPDVTASTAATPPATATIAELAKAGALEILGPARLLGPDATASGDSPDRPVLTVKDVLQDRAASGQSEGVLIPEVVVQAGDVVVPVVARRLTARVVATAGALLGRNLFLLRPNHAVLDPWFLAGQLRTSMNERQASSLSGVLRFDIRRAQVSRIALAEQRRYAEAVGRLDAFDSALRQAAALGADLVQLAADGLARGVLQPNGTPVTGQARPRRGKAKKTE